MVRSRVAFVCLVHRLTKLSKHPLQHVVFVPDRQMELEKELVDRSTVIYSLEDFTPELFGLPPFQ
jgi:hypothetical protein